MWNFLTIKSGLLRPLSLQMFFKEQPYGGIEAFLRSIFYEYVSTFLTIKSGLLRPLSLQMFFKEQPYGGVEAFLRSIFYEYVSTFLTIKSGLLRPLSLQMFFKEQPYGGVEAFLRSISYAISILCLLAMVTPSSSEANEMLRIIGMGGTRIATSAADAGIFGNPASLVSVKHHNLAFGIASENLHWTELPKHDRDQFAAEVNTDLYPSVYYSHAFGEWGISAGYIGTSTNYANFTLAATRAEYNINARRFSAETDFITDYSLFHEQNWVLGLSRKVAGSIVGTRLKWVAQDVKTGVVVSTLNLAARHGPDIDVHAPDQLIAAITEELQFGDRIRDLVHEEQPTYDRTANRLELDIGLQREIWFDTHRTNPPLYVGILFENLLRSNLVEPLPFRLGIGVAYEPLKWIAVGADLWRDSEQSGLGFAIGIELHKTWRSGYPITPALRVGAGRENATLHFSVGAGLRLGTTYLEYTFGLGSFTYTSNRHLLAFTLRL